MTLEDQGNQSQWGSISLQWHRLEISCYLVYYCNDFCLHCRGFRAPADAAHDSRALWERGYIVRGGTVWHRDAAATLTACLWRILTGWSGRSTGFWRGNSPINWGAKEASRLVAPPPKRRAKMSIRRTRTLLSYKQQVCLQEALRRGIFPCPREIDLLSTQTGLVYKRVYSWFQNRRHKLLRVQYPQMANI